MKKHSILLTVHNKEKLIKKVLASIIKNTPQPYELIIVFDGCEDRSELIAKKYLNKRSNKKIDSTFLYADDVFETKANNIGLKKCTGDLISIIQDDMVIAENEWNLNLAKPFKSFNDVFSVTAHTSHNVRFVPPKEDEKPGEYFMLSWPDQIGYRTHDRKPSRDIFHIRLTSNRGPLMVSHEYLEKLNYLDEIFSPQTCDDHDLNMRARLKYDLVTGFYPIDFISEHMWGTTRNDDGGQQEWNIKAEQKNMKIIYERYKEVIKNEIVESREIK